LPQCIGAAPILWKSLVVERDEKWANKKMLKVAWKEENAEPEDVKSGLRPLKAHSDGRKGRTENAAMLQYHW